MSAGLRAVALLVLTVLPCLTVGSYEASWERGENSLTWLEAKQFCASRGKQMLSLDTTQKASAALSYLTAAGRPYFWTGGRKTSSRSSTETVAWPNGRQTQVSVTGRGSFPWSTSGTRGAQPDGGDQEQCIAVLNIKFYQDGSKLHDISCGHRKPVVCE